MALRQHAAGPAVGARAARRVDLGPAAVAGPRLLRRSDRVIGHEADAVRELDGGPRAPYRTAVRVRQPRSDPAHEQARRAQAGTGSGFAGRTSASVASVSRTTLATDTAFSSASRTTFAGSMIPASKRST